MDVLLLRFDAPLVSFGGPMVDQRGPTLPFPGRSLLTGLVANALGYDHSDRDRLNALQSRLVYGARCDREGRRITDFHTIDLGQPFLAEGWTTRGVAEGRDGASKESTHIRLREYLADCRYLVALTLLDSTHRPSLDDVEKALGEPERPLFLGRKSCLPASPILAGRMQCTSLVEALERAGPVDGGGFDRDCTIWIPEEEEAHLTRPHRPLDVVDERDWLVQLNGGRRRILQSVIRLREAEA